MKLLFISYELPPLGGGGGRAAWQIARRLAKRGHEVAILSSLFPGLAREELSEGVKIIRLKVLRRKMDECSPLELLSFMFRSMRAVKKLNFKPSVACAFFGIPGGPAARRLFRKEKVPYVLSVRGSDVPRSELAAWQRLHLLTRPLLRRIYRDASGIIAVSGQLKHAAQKVAPDVEIEVIPNGIDLPEDRGPRSMPDGVPRLLFVGRLREFKGAQDAIEALPRIVRALMRPVRFVIVGEGPYRRELFHIAEGIRLQEPSVHVEFKGWLSSDKIQQEYRSASALLLPSYIEGHSNVILEALAAGLPCVATDTPGIHDTIVSGRQGFLVLPHDPGAIARAVVALLSDRDQWARMSARAHTRAMEFSWDRVAEEYETVLLRAEKSSTR